MFYFHWIYLTCVEAQSLFSGKSPVENKKSLTWPRKGCRSSSDNKNQQFFLGLNSFSKDHFLRRLTLNNNCGFCSPWKAEIAL